MEVGTVTVTDETATRRIIATVMVTVPTVEIVAAALKAIHMRVPSHARTAATGMKVVAIR